MDSVQIRHAKARFSALIKAAERGRPTTITRHAGPAAVVVPGADARRLYPAQSYAFADLLLSFPGPAESERDETPLRDTILEPRLAGRYFGAVDVGAGVAATDARMGRLVLRKRRKPVPLRGYDCRDRTGVCKLRRTHGGERAERLTLWLDTVLADFADRVLALDATVGHRAGGISDRAPSAGRHPGFADVAIAATAAEHGMGLLTRNTPHFEPLGIAVIDPGDATPPCVIAPSHVFTYRRRGHPAMFEAGRPPEGEGLGTGQPVTLIRLDPRRKTFQVRPTRKSYPGHPQHLPRALSVLKSKNAEVRA